MIRKFAIKVEWLLHLFFWGGSNVTHFSVESNTRSHPCSSHYTPSVTLSCWIHTELLSPFCTNCALLNGLFSRNPLSFTPEYKVFSLGHYLPFYSLNLPFSVASSCWLENSGWEERQHYLLPVLPVTIEKDSLSCFHSARGHNKEYILAYRRVNI